MDERYIAAIDLGSARISLGVAQVQGDNTQIIYYDSVPSEGVRTGAVFNPQRCGTKIRELLDKAEDELKIHIHQIVTNYPKYGAEQQLATGELPRTDPMSSISDEELDSLKNVSLDSYPLDNSATQLIYGAVVQSFATEEYINAREDDVVGMISAKLYGNYKLFIGSKRTSDYIDAACNMAQIAISDKYFGPEVEGKAVLTMNEMENGVALINMGAGVTSVTVYHKGVLRYYGAIPFGGKTITEDIRYESGFSESLAENIKLAFGACLPDKLQNLSDKILQVDCGEDIPPKNLSVKYLSEIVTARQKEILEAMLWHIQKSGLADNLRSGVVLTGGGCELVNTANLLRDISGYSVRIGAPRRFFTTGCDGLNSPAATTCAGLIMEARKHPHINCAEIPETIEVEMAPPQREELFPEEKPEEEPQPEVKEERVKEKKSESRKPKKERTIKVVKPPKPPKEPREIKLPNWIKKIGEFQETLFDGMDERSDESINNRG